LKGHQLPTSAELGDAAKWFTKWFTSRLKIRRGSTDRRSYSRSVHVGAEVTIEPTGRSRKIGTFLYAL